VSVERRDVSTFDGEVPLGDLPPLGAVPSRMTALVVRAERFGDPADAFQVETGVPVPKLGPKEVLLGVKAAGVNYNNVWAARGYPVDVIGARQRQGEPEDFHIGGSDASGIVYAVGDEVTDVAVGDDVIIHPGYWDDQDPWVLAGKDPMIATSAQIWGYNTNYGSFAQFSRVQEHQVLPKARHLSWVEAAAPTLVGTTAYRMLHGWAGNEVQADDVVLVWGGSGGLGTQALQLARRVGAKPIAVVSDDERGRYAEKFGAIGYINRGDFDHWGIPPLIDDEEGQAAWQAQARAFKKRIWEIAGERKDPAIVFEHPGSATIPTSILVCAPGGMVVICAGTTGYDAVVDLRHHWTRQKRLQGSHGVNDDQARAYNDLVCNKEIDPVLGRAVAFDELPRVHSEMARGELVFGNSVARVSAADNDEGRATS
jgi:crotonyl-CoA carboxylase/reductase